MVLEEFTPKKLGWKLYGLYEFSKIGLFKRPFLILSNSNTKEEIIDVLTSKGFKDGDELAIRFSKDDSMNLPFFLGKFSLEEVAKIVLREKKDYLPFVHGLVKSEFSAHVYYDGKIIFVELWPGIGASKKNVLNECPDIIKIDTKIHISKYLKDRSVETVEGLSITALPFSMDFLIVFAKKCLSLKESLESLLKIKNPLLCDVNAESIDDMNFMGMQESNKITFSGANSLMKNIFIARSLEDLELYTSSQELFFDVPLDRTNQDWTKLLKLLKKAPKVYLKSLTNHLAVILRESGVIVDRYIPNNDYELKEISF